MTAVKSRLLTRAPSTSVWHDPPHASGLVKDKMHGEFGYLPVIHEIIRQIYSHFSRSPCALAPASGVESSGIRRKSVARERWETTSGIVR